MRPVLATGTRLLQAAVALACLIPLLAGAAGVALGPALVGMAAPSADLDSHFRYLSGLLFGMGLAFASTIPKLGGPSPLFRSLGFVVIVGGLARLLSLAVAGPPGPTHLLALGMELGVVPLLLFWQWRLSRRYLAGAKD